MAVLQLSHKISPLTYHSAYGPLNPINPDNARVLRITAAAGTKLADPYSNGTISFGTRPKVFSRSKEVYNP